MLKGVDNMSDMFDYIKWRGDILFTELSLNPVDALIFSTLSYISFDGYVAPDLSGYITLKEFADNFFEQKEYERKIRVKSDLKLLREASQSKRFGTVLLGNYRNILLNQKDTQFSAITFYLPDGMAYLAFRGTDRSITGWKEDFNMTFQESIPSQRLALQYVEEFCSFIGASVYLGGHSKGGNLAVYAAAKCESDVQERILAVYNQDGPGFTDNLMGYSGYQTMVPKIHTYIPQSSIVGMLLEHEEPYIIIKSRQIGGAMQHDPYTWEVMGRDFIYMEEVTDSSKHLNRVIKKWLAAMSKEERDVFVEKLFALLESGDAEEVWDIIEPKNLISYVRILKADEGMRKLLIKELSKLVLELKPSLKRRKKESTELTL